MHFLGGSEVKASVCNAGDLGSIPGSEDPLEKEMVTHSSTLAWKMPWMKAPGRLESMGSQTVIHDWATSLFMYNPCRLVVLPFTPHHSQKPKSNLDFFLSSFTANQITKSYRLYLLNIPIIWSFLSNLTARALLPASILPPPGKSW